MKLKLRSPWVIAHEKFKALFGRDPGVEIDFDEKNRIISLRVDSQRKADALYKLLPPEYELGNATLRVKVFPGNAGESLPDDATTADVLLAAFDGNPVVTQVRQVSKGLFRDLVYCVFRREVVQYPADNLADINGNESTLMECIARELLAADPVKGFVYYCTSAGMNLADSDKFDKPLGEWP